MSRFAADIQSWLWRSGDCVTTIRWCPNSKASRVSASNGLCRPSSKALSKTIWRRIPCFLSRPKKQRATSSTSPMSCNRKNFLRFWQNSPCSSTVSLDWLASIFNTESVAATDLPTPASANTAVVPIELSFKTSNISSSKTVSLIALDTSNWSSKGRIMFFIWALFLRLWRNFSQLP